MAPLTGARILVTGASGFIGGRLTECLCASYGAVVHAVARRSGTAGFARLVRLRNVTIFHGDIARTDVLARAAEGCRFAVHCAQENQGNVRAQEESSHRGLRKLLEAAARAGMERVVHLSSASVVSPAGKIGNITEETPADIRFPYARLKMKTEEWLKSIAAEYGLWPVILRPTCVWGPFSPVWTVNPALLMRQGTFVPPAGGEGTANLVYVDNLVDAIVLSLVRADVAGRTLTINDDEPARWKELFDGYAAALGMAVPSSPKAFLIPPAAGGLLLRMKGRLPLAQTLWNALPERARQFLRRNVPPDPSTVDLFTARCRYSNRKAREILGWKPRLSFQEAMARTQKFLTE